MTYIHNDIDYDLDATGCEGGINVLLAVVQCVSLEAAYQRITREKMERRSFISVIEAMFGEVPHILTFECDVVEVVH